MLGWNLSCVLMCSGILQNFHVTLCGNELSSHKIFSPWKRVSYAKATGLHCIDIMLTKDALFCRTTVGEALSAKLKWSFRDADSFHSEENKQKMSKGQPLTDQDRYPWLCSIHDHMATLIRNKESGIVTCSALKKEYRKILLIGSTAVEQCDVALSKGNHNTDGKKSRVQKYESESSPIVGSLSRSDLYEKDEKGVLTTEISLHSPEHPENLIGQVLFIHLTGSEKLLTERLTLRKDHFMPASLLRSQIETLEEMDTTENGLTVSVDKPVDLIVQDIIKRLELNQSKCDTVSN